MNERLEKLTAQFSEKAKALSPFRDECAWMVDRADLVGIATALKNHPETPFPVLVDLTAVDQTPNRGTIEVVYHLASPQGNVVLRLKVPLPAEDPVVPTISHLWRSADWMEREVFDLFGVKFSDHPDLRRIVMPDDYEGFPLLKEHPLCPQGDCDDF